MEKPDTQPDLAARIDATLKATEGHTPGLWVADYVGDNSYLVSSVTPGTIDGNLRQVGLITHMPDDARMEDAALIASAPTLRALLVEAHAQLAAQGAALAKAGELVETLNGIQADYAAGLDDARNYGQSTDEELAEAKYKVALECYRAALGAQS